jgi:uncharacterized protein (DUF362 family)
MPSTITLCNTCDRAYGVRAAVKALGMDPVHNPLAGKKVLLKPNFNSADPPPASTDNDTLEALIDLIWSLGASSITLGERSWKGTRRVIEQKGLMPLLKQKQVELLVFDELPETDWLHIHDPSHHWPKGFLIAKPLLGG